MAEQQDSSVVEPVAAAVQASATAPPLRRRHRAASKQEQPPPPEQEQKGHLLYHQLPDFLQDNEFIRTGYRRALVWGHFFVVNPSQPHDKLGPMVHSASVAPCCCCCCACMHELCFVRLAFGILLVSCHAHNVWVGGPDSRHLCPQADLHRRTRS